ncbi:MAG: PilN domain-containing protein [Deltaproteobacteria bacterium]|nr:PilN domain-containing protein [Deltaproteobacteria bacterium]
MIRINLLPVRATRRAEQGKLQLILGVVLIAGVFVGNYFWYSAADDAKRQVESQVAALDQKIKDIERIIGEVKDIEKRQKELEKKLEVIEDLRKKRTGPVKMMGSLATLIPKEVWLTTMAEKGGGMTMEGQAMSHEHLAIFISALQASPSFKGVRLVDATLVASPAGEGEVVNFKLTGQADYSAI